MYIYIYVYTFIQKLAVSFGGMKWLLREHVSVFMYIFIHTFILVDIFMCVYVFTHTHVHSKVSSLLISRYEMTIALTFENICRYVSMQTYVYTHICTCIHVYTYAHIHSKVSSLLIYGTNGLMHWLVRKIWIYTSSIDLWEGLKMCIYTYVYIFIYMYGYVHTYILIHTFIQKSAHSSFNGTKWLKRWLVRIFTSANRSNALDWEEFQAQEVASHMHTNTYYWDTS